MLTQVLHEIITAREPLSLTRLSAKLGVEPSALEGMLAFWVRKGRLRDDDAEEALTCQTGSAGGCGHTCTGPETCAFVAKTPKRYSLPTQREKDAVQVYIRDVESTVLERERRE